MGSEQDRGWTINTEREYTYLRGGAKSFYESRATHPIYGETIPARSIDEQTAYQETLARIARIESELGSAIPMAETVETGEAAAEAETEAGSANSTPDVQTDTAAIILPAYDLSSAIPMPGAMHTVAPALAPPPASGDIEQENKQVVDPLAAEFGYNTRPLNLTRRVENELANHRRVPRRRPAGHVISGRLE